jgi:hypothetical protein
MENKMVTVHFHGAELLGFNLGGNVYVAVKPIVDALGLDWEAQRARIKRDPALLEGTFITKVPSAGSFQDTLCLLLDYLNGWLFKIQSTRIPDEAIRTKVQAFQRECYRVLFRHFSGDREKLDREANDTMSLHLRLCQESRHIHGSRAADQLWIKLGLPRVPAMDDAFDKVSCSATRRRLRSFSILPSPQHARFLTAPLETDSQRGPSLPFSHP